MACLEQGTHSCKAPSNPLQDGLMTLVVSEHGGPDTNPRMLWASLLEGCAAINDWNLGFSDASKGQKARIFRI